VNLAPWEYLFVPFAAHEFKDLFWPILVGSLVWLVVLVVLYNIRTRQLHAHAPYVDLYEWLLWTGVITFTLVIIYAIFRFDFFFVPATLLAGLLTFAWVRFIHFPPIFATYATRLAKQRYFTRSKYAHPESTIRAKTVRRASGKPVRVAPSKRGRKRR
jgi:hypothetical protein